MKLLLSPKGHAQGKHLVVLTNQDDRKQVQEILEGEVLSGKRKVRREFWHGNPNSVRPMTLFRLHMDYMDRILLALPQIQRSSGIDKLCRKQFEDEILSLPVPDIEVPGLDPTHLTKGQLFPWQKVAIKMISEHRHFMLNDDLGLGKTLTALCSMVLGDYFPALVVCPNNGKWAWELIIQTFFPDLDFVVVDGDVNKRQRQISQSAAITIVNCESLRVKEEYEKIELEDGTHEWELESSYSHPGLFFNANGKRRRWRYVVIDEHHRFKNPTAQQTLGFLQLRSNHFLLMSGTPIMNRVEEIWTALHRMFPRDFPEYGQFIQRYCITNRKGEVVAYRIKEMAELKRWLQGTKECGFLDAQSLRRRRDQVIKDAPPVIYSKVPVMLTPEARRLYNKIKDEFILEIEGGKKLPVKNVVMRLRQACFSPELYGGTANSAKLEHLREIVEELVAAGHKAIIFTSWKKSARIIEREFAKYSPAYIDASVTGRRRKEAAHRFNTDDDCKLFIGTIKANQEAITLSKATYVIFTDKEWTPMANQQAAGRSAAGGLRGMGLPPGTKVNIIELQAHDTIEERIEALLDRKQATFDAFVERDGGVKRTRITIQSIKELM